MRNRIPIEFRDLALWPTADYRALAEADAQALLRRTQAVHQYAQRVPIGDIERATGIPRVQLYRMITRCLSVHPDGRIRGFRGLIPYSRVRPYRRTKPVAPTTRVRKSGSSGAMTALLERFESLRDFVKRELSLHNVYFGARGELCGLHEVHLAFLSQCRELGITSADYPFSQERKGIRSLGSAIRKMASASVAEAARASGATRISNPWSNEKFAESGPTHPYEVVEFDGHKLDIRLTIRFEAEGGILEYLEVGRIWLLVIIDVFSRAILGWNLVLAPEYNRHDVMRTVQHALSRQRLRAQYAVTGLAPALGAGLIPEAIPYLTGACWERMRLDNAKANLAIETLSLLETVVGCVVEAGPVGQPTQRPFVERFFRTLESHLGHRLPATTGASPSDIRRRLTDPKGRDTLPVTVDELSELLEVSIANYNGTPHDGIGARSPLEFLTRAIEFHRDAVRILSEPFRRQLFLFNPCETRTVCGSPSRGLRPYINLHGVRYSSATLQHAVDLIGKTIRVYVDPQDLTLVHAYLSDGAELGSLNAARPWHRTKHSLRLRQEIQRLRRQRKLHFTDADDPVRVFLAYKRKELPRSKKSAHSTAQAARDLQAAPEAANKPSVPPPAQASADPVLPIVKPRPLLRIGKGQVTRKPPP